MHDVVKNNTPKYPHSKKHFIQRSFKNQNVYLS